MRTELCENGGNHRQSLIARLLNALDTPDKQIQEMSTVTPKRGRPVGAKNKHQSKGTTFRIREGQKV
jgi:hypothetical protein